MKVGMSDSWVPSVCYMCYSCCGIKVRQEEGVAVEITGEPDNPHNQGKLRAKGKAGIISLYRPYRVKKPMLRTTSAKGVGIDPQWKEISWDEALALIPAKLKEIQEGGGPKVFTEK